jgi:hypothetical protein
MRAEGDRRDSGNDQKKLIDRINLFFGIISPGAILFNTCAAKIKKINK